MRRASSTHTRGHSAASQLDLESLKFASPRPFWLDDPEAPPCCEALVEDDRCELAVVGGGYTGLWTALLAKQENPGLDVSLLEATSVGGSASGRNGGFCSVSLTHGFANGLRKFPQEMPQLERLGFENLDEIERSVQQLGIDCDFERTGILHVATEPHQVEGLPALAEELTRFGHQVVLLDEEATRRELDSPTYRAALWDKNATALVNPARLAWGLKGACAQAGVRIYENTPVLAIRRSGRQLRLQTPYASMFAHQVVLGTNAYPPLVRRLRRYIVPVYDYALMTEPLDDAQLASVGWSGRQGVDDMGNQFHYYRLSKDNRVHFGGFDAVYHFGSSFRSELEQRPATFARLARHFFATFPQLEGLRFTHAWGGAIDTCSRLFAFHGRSHAGDVTYAIGFTGLGVAASHFSARLMLDLLAGEPTERTRLAAPQARPFPFPPEPFRFLTIQLTQWSLARADRNAGRRNLWLRLLDREGIGFDT